MISRKWSRRQVLKGMLRGSAVTVALPMLDLFLNDNGLALASGAPLPTRFGTWFWGCGINADRWIPDNLGPGYDLKAELKAIKAHQDKVSVLSGFNCVLGGKPDFMHWSGAMATLSGTAPTEGGVGYGNADAPTIDCLVADAFGSKTRFRSLEIACTGDPKVSYSMRKGSTVNPSEVDPVRLYKRLFGPEFQDPNSADFQPDPEIMLRQSVLSSIKDERQKLIRTVGAEDRARVDQYFTNVREMEEQLALMLQKPEPLEACELPRQPRKSELGPVWDTAVANHRVLGKLLVHALACNQTQVFNLAFTSATSNLRKPGASMAHHNLTHVDPVDPKLGYQPEAAFFIEGCMNEFAAFLDLMDSVKEGDGTLLDHSLILATSDTNSAKVHSIDSLPIMVAGRANGKLRSGRHIAGQGDPSSRVGLTIQQVLGMPVSSWGTEAMQTTKAIDELIET
ncbi:DUF1552 domain-containing protein [Aestuariicella hydrocarbonica]|uniref:DUF1552 domain-containing protein n=1 Tax=Pseudomaricurvus hydrocarbonicus TaxID=1470433 RepID=A0A9E5MMS0_9GAMM|nr:DUF1552 domain-containing protein [Aestuariicella hydrocarbonica]NHO67102.1 DUF1552 domain-containing protein [Aestuariicella hydrocarbonica]